MLKLVFLVLVFFHGLLHLTGFVKAFHLASVQQVTSTISKPAGLLWLLTALLFLLTVVLLIIKNEYNWLTGLVAVFMSQVFVVLYWKDAKFGSIANLVILLPLLANYGQWRFNQSYKKERAALLASMRPSVKRTIDMGNWRGLPPVVQRWLERSGVSDRAIPAHIYLEQKGEMKTSPSGKWIPFAAEQYSILEQPGFIWKTTINPSSFISLSGRDRLVNGEGDMKINLYGLYPVAHAAGLEISQGSLLRWLAEMNWYPVAALESYVKWEELGERSAKATIRYGNTQASGQFYFTNEGDLAGFEAERYYIEGREKPRLEKWVVKTVPGAYKYFNGIRIPYQSTVTWQLKAGDYEWLKLEIVSIDYK